MRCGGARHGRPTFGKNALNALKAGCDFAERAHAAEEFPESDKKEGEPKKPTDRGAGRSKHRELSVRKRVGPLPNALS
jgi:hypothetical protein